MSDPTNGKKPWAVFINPPAAVHQNFNHANLAKNMISFMEEKAESIRQEFVRAGMEDQIEFVSKMPVLYMISVRATDAAMEKLKTLKEVHSVEPNIFTGPMPEEDKRLLEERRRTGAKPNKPKP